MAQAFKIKWGTFSTATEFIKPALMKRPGHSFAVGPSGKEFGVFVRLRQGRPDKGLVVGEFMGGRLALRRGRT